MKKIVFSTALFMALAWAFPAFSHPVGDIDGYWLKTGPANGAPNFLAITGDTMRIDRRRPVKIFAMQSGDEVIVRLQNVKKPGYGLSDNNFDAMHVVDWDTMMVSRPALRAGQPARQTIYRRIGYEEAKKYLPRKAKKRKR